MVEFWQEVKLDLSNNIFNIKTMNKLITFCKTLFCALTLSQKEEKSNLYKFVKDNNLSFTNQLTRVLIILMFTLNSNAQIKSLVFKGEKRKYIIYTPKSYNPNDSKNYPLVFNFHGGGMSMAEQMLYTQMNKTADKYNFIVVYPKGIKEDWNVGFGMSYKKGTDDIGFIDSLTTKISKDYKINSKKIFATGLSRGGFFCYRIATELSHKFAAVVAIGATMPDSVAIYNKRKNKIGVMIVHGTDDLIVDYNGKKNDYYSATDTYNYWKEQNNLEQANEKKIFLNKNKQDETYVEVLETSNKQQTVKIFTINNGGHTWPGADDFNIGLPLGKTSGDINLNEHIWIFFNTHGK